MVTTGSIEGLVSASGETMDNKCLNKFRVA